MTENIGEGCLHGSIVVCLVCLISLGIIGLIDSFTNKKHCRNCGRIVKYENYCPDCGTKTDSALIYNYWNKP